MKKNIKLTKEENDILKSAESGGLFQLYLKKEILRDIQK